MQWLLRQQGINTHKTGQSHSVISFQKEAESGKQAPKIPAPEASEGAQVCTLSESVLAKWFR